MSASGQLVFASAAKWLNLKADPDLPDLYQARFSRYVPQIRVQEDMVTIEYSNFPFLDRVTDLRGPLAELTLNGAIPWEIEFRNGISHLNADLRQLQLRSLDILNGARQIRLRLARPSGTTYINISGGLTQGTIQLPNGPVVRVQVSGGATGLVFEGQRFNAIEAETSLASPGFNRASGAVDIRLAGGTSAVTINRSISSLRSSP